MTALDPTQRALATAAERLGELLQGEEALPGFGGFEPPLDVGDPNPLLLSRR